MEEKEIFRIGYEALLVKANMLSDDLQLKKDLDHSPKTTKNSDVIEQLPNSVLEEEQNVQNEDTVENGKQDNISVVNPAVPSCISSDKILQKDKDSGFTDGVEKIDTIGEIEIIDDLINVDIKTDASVDVPEVDQLVGECTPIEPHGKKQRAESPNTMIRKVKSRTLNDDRKKICYESDEDNKDIVAESYDVSDDSDDDDQPGGVDCVVPINTKKATVRQLKKETRDSLQARWSKGQKSTVVWRGTPEFGSYVSMKDTLMVLNDERISNSVVDCWGELLVIKYESTKDTMVFLTLGWDYINGFNGRDRSKAVCNVVDKRIEKGVGRDHVLLFPMLTKGNGRHEQGDHWTLLEFNLSECEWRFFNSIEPRSKKIQDIHYSRALVLVNYVQIKVRDVFKIKFPDHPIHKSTLKDPLPVYGPQQVHGSLDCGVVVCSNLENLISRTEITKDRFKHDDAANYRGKIVEWFFSARKNKLN